MNVNLTHPKIKSNFFSLLLLNSTRWFNTFRIFIFSSPTQEYNITQTTVNFLVDVLLQFVLFFFLLQIFLSFSLYNNTINIYINIWRTTVCECFLAHLTGCQVKLNYFLSCNDSVKYNLNYSNCYYTHVRLRLHASKNGLQDTYTYIYNNHMFTYTLCFTTSVNVGSIMVFLFSKRNTFAWSARLLKFMVIMNWLILYHMQNIWQIFCMC